GGRAPACELPGDRTGPCSPFSEAIPEGTRGSDKGTGRDGYAGEGREQSSPSLILSFFGLLLGARHPGAAPVQMLVRQARPAREHQPRAPSAPGGPRAGLEPYTGRAGGGDGGREQDHGSTTPDTRG
ncbi:unnamed protein product, partial [Prorocentrum cordatum]